MTAKLAAVLLLAICAASGQTDDKPVVQLNGGMEAQLLSLGRQRDAVLTAAVKITNKGPDHVFLLVYGIPSAIDDTGGRFDVLQSVSGVAFCEGPHELPPRARVCVGIPKIEEQYLFPLQGYTEI